MNKQEVIAGISEGCKAIKSGKVKLSKALVETLIHIHEHGDWTVANTVIDTIKNYDGNMTFEAACAVKWLRVYGGLQVEDGQFVGWKGKDYIASKLNEAKENPYYGQIKISNPFEFDLREKLLGLLTSVNNAKKKQRKAALLGDDSVVVNIDDDMLEALKAVASGDFNFTEEAA